MRRLGIFLFISLVSPALFAEEEVRKYTIRKDLNYGDSDNQKHTLDLYLPKIRNLRKPLPVVIWIHGGGWRSGDKQSGSRIDRLHGIASTGRYVGASISYRLSTQSKWPAQIHDCKAAIRWLRGNAEKFEIDPNRIAVWGSSAGGHLASFIGTTAGLPGFEGKIGKYPLKSTRVQAVINYYGPSAFLRMDDFPSKIIHNSPYSPESRLIGTPIQKAKEKAREASPITHVSEDDPPFLHLHGTEDPLVPFNQSEILHDALEAKQVTSSLVTVRNRGHSMPGIYTWKFVIPFLDFHLLDRGQEISTQEVVAPDPKPVQKR